jgi:hypothetical protein
MIVNSLIVVVRLRRLGDTRPVFIVKNNDEVLMLEEPCSLHVGSPVTIGQLIGNIWNLSANVENNVFCILNQTNVPPSLATLFWHRLITSVRTSFADVSAARLAISVKRTDRSRWVARWFPLKWFSPVSTLSSRWEPSATFRGRYWRATLIEWSVFGIVNLGGGRVAGMIDGSSGWWVEGGARLVGTGAPSYRHCQVNHDHDLLY